MRVSDCCGAPAYSNGDSDTEDIGICPDCKEHCEYIGDNEDEEDDSFEPCSNCDLPDGCADFGCAIKSGVRKKYPIDGVL